MKKILIVDDEEDVLKVLEKRLTDEGCEVITAKNGIEGVAKAKKELPSLIILDIVMPQMNGWEVAQLLKGEDKTRNIPIIFLTCLYNKEDEKKVGHSSGTNFLFAKPFEFSELMNIINKNVK
jgi:DNA-binding response OmpR family regulator